MAWGRGGYDDLDDLDDYSTFRKAQRISSHAVEDGGAISSASRRHDQRLLNDITSRLVNAQYSQPVQAPRTHRKPPLPPTASVHRVVIPGRPSATYNVGGYRAASVPPRDASLESEVDDYMIGASRPIRSSRASSVAPRGTYESKRSYRAASEPPLPPVADLAVRQAKRYLSRVENELGVSSIGGVDPYSVDDLPIVTSRSVRTGYNRASVPLRAHHPVMPTRTTSIGGHARIRLGSLPPPSPTFSRRGLSTDYDLEDRLETLSVPDVPPKTSYSQLRQQANSARDKMDQHKVLLDRYLPIYMGPENEVEYEVDYKFGELADRMPHLDPYRPPMPYHPPVDVAPYKPAARGGSGGDLYGKPPSGYGFRPKMSDTRKRIREVICSTRRDPGYYD